MKKINAFIGNFSAQLLRILPIFMIALFFRVIIKERLNNGKDRFVFQKKSKRYTVLALDSERYRGDIDILAQSNIYRVLHIRQGWQLIVVKAFLKGKHYVSEVENLDKNSILGKQHIKTKDFVFNILNKLFKMIDISCVTTVHFKYIADYYWVLSSEKLNVPWIMLYRECNVMSPIIYDAVVSMMKKQEPFLGSHVIVHNSKIREAFLESNFCLKNKITVASALRMDQLVKKSKELENSPISPNENKRKKFTLFYFPIDSSMFGSMNKSVDIQKYYPDGNFWINKEKYFTLLHQVILELAEENKDIDFVIKPKEIFLYDESWRYYQKIISNSSVDITKLKNYSIDPNANVHNLIEESDIICGGQSSTTIESIIMKKQMILPLFCDYQKTDYFAQFPWKDYLDLFNIVLNPQSFKDTFYKLINSHDINEDQMIRRKDLYLSCFDDYTGNALCLYTRTIEKVIKNNL